MLKRLGTHAEGAGNHAERDLRTMQGATLLQCTLGSSCLVKGLASDLLLTTTELTLNNLVVQGARLTVNLTFASLCKCMRNFSVARASLLLSFAAICHKLSGISRRRNTGCCVRLHISLLLMPATHS